jgi:tRNA nucleotidyltransferase/poly(A) polymerase
MASFEINENHRRALASALQHVERTLKEFVQLVAEAQPRLPAAQTQELAKRIVIAQQHVKDFRLRFKLPENRRRGASWAIQVGVAHLWEILEDCKSEPLRGYGQIPEATKPALDKEVQELIDALQNIAAAARSKK